ncbi:unnamed protein product [Hydatigera taeniaeformis]|uniref:Uncharacterized protein n=1 Tax=Hydatigena taeniaeformis TaxID=6205 RepID=A0A3P7EXK1_HYDTA|nr:unnamed protein product [Hydatigera taeniaeformis]
MSALIAIISSNLDFGNDLSWHPLVPHRVVSAKRAAITLVESQSAAKSEGARSGSQIESATLELSKRLTLLELREVC